MDSTVAWPQIITIADPAAGAGFSRDIPGESFERLDTLRLQLVASGAAANRFLSVDVLDGDGVIIARIQSATAVTAGQTARFTFARGIGATLTGGVLEQLLPLPDVIYPPGCQFLVAIANVDAGDQLSVIRAVITRYPSGKVEPSRGSVPYQP